MWDTFSEKFQVRTKDGKLAKNSESAKSGKSIRPQIREDRTASEQ